MAKRGDWSKTNVHMWGKRHGLGLLDVLQNEAAASRDKKDSWGKNNVRMWGKRGYDSYDDDGDYVNYDWLDVVPPLTHDKRDSKLESAAVNSVGRVMPHGWTKNAWERNNMRIWG